MSLSNRERLQRTMARLTRRAVQSGSELSHVDAMAVRLSSKYPQSGMTVNEIAKEIVARFLKELEHSRGPPCQ